MFIPDPDAGSGSWFLPIPGSGVKKAPIRICNTEILSSVIYIFGQKRTQLYNSNSWVTQSVLRIRFLTSSESYTSLFTNATEYGHVDTHKNAARTNPFVEDSYILSPPPPPQKKMYTLLTFEKKVNPY